MPPPPTHRSRHRSRLRLGLGLGVCLGVGSWGAASWSAEAEVWAAMHNGRLTSSLDRDPLQSIAIYEAVLEHLPRRDPQRGDLLLALGRAHLDAGNPESARATLTEAAALPSAREAASQLLQLIDLWEQRVSDLPHHSTPDARLSPGESWRLTFSDPTAPIEEIHLRLRSEGASTLLRIELESFDGWRLPILDAIEVPTDTWLELPLEMTDLRAVFPSSPSTGGGGVGGDRRLWMLSLHVLEGTASPSTLLHIAQVEIR